MERPTISASMGLVEVVSVSKAKTDALDSSLAMASRALVVSTSTTSVSSAWGEAGAGPLSSAPRASEGSSPRGAGMRWAMVLNSSSRKTLSTSSRV